jgi:pilus assembly protein CpaB
MLAAAVVLGLAAAFVAAVYLTGEQQRLEAGVRMVPVLVAREDIAPGTSVADIIASKKAEVRQVAQKYAVEGALGSLKGLEDRVLGAPLVKGDQLATARLASAEAVGLAYTVPKGQVAITVPVDEVRGVAGMLRPGDWVAVLGTVQTIPTDDTSWRTAAMLPRVHVLAVGSSAGGSAPSAQTPAAGTAFASTRTQSTPAASSVTLAVMPGDAARIVFVAEKGKVWLTLLSSAETSPARTGAQSCSTVLGK